MFNIIAELGVTSFIEIRFAFFLMQMFLNVKIPIHAYKSVLHQGAKLTGLPHQLSMKMYRRVASYYTSASERHKPRCKTDQHLFWQLLS